MDWQLIPSGSPAAFLPSCASVSTNPEDEDESCAFSSLPAWGEERKAKGLPLFFPLTVCDSAVSSFFFFADPSVNWEGR